MASEPPHPNLIRPQVLLLAQGRLAYLGPPSNVGPAFGAAGYPCPPGRQPAEHMLHVASQPTGLAALLRRMAAPPADAGADAVRTGDASCAGAVGGLGDDATGSSGLGQQRGEAAAKGPKACEERVTDGGWAVTVDMRQADGGVSRGHVSRKPTAVSEAAASAASAGAGAGGALRRAGDWAGGVLRECAVLYWRAFTNMRREPRLLLLHLLVALVLGLVVGAVFFKLDTSNVGLQNRLGAMFFALALFGWTSVSVVDGQVHEPELVERVGAGRS